MKGKILIIEDNPENYYLMRYLLENQGYQVEGAENGSLGLRLAHIIIPDCILLDIQLPGMDGYCVAQALRANPALDAIPVIAVTSYAMPGDRERALECGANAYIEKPIDPELFVDEVEQHIERFNKERGAK